MAGALREGISEPLDPNMFWSSASGLPSVALTSGSRLRPGEIGVEILSATRIILRSA